MKKVILMMSVLLSCGLFCACSSDDETNGSGSGGTMKPDPALIPDDGEVLTPIEMTNRYLWNEESEKVAMICSFFNEGLPIGKRSESFFVGSDKDECYVINSLQELKSIYCGDKEYPELDFDKYTLVIGQKVNPDAFYPVLKQDLTFLDNKCLLNIYVPDFKELNTTNVPFYYWALYPKFNTEGINVGFIREEGSVMSVKDVYCHTWNLFNMDQSINNDRWFFWPYWRPGEDYLFASACIFPLNLSDKVNVSKLGLIDDLTFSGEIVKMTDDALSAIGFTKTVNDYYFAYLNEIDVKEYDEVIPYRGTVPFTITDMPGVVCYDWDQQTYFIAYIMDYSKINPYFSEEEYIVTRYYLDNLSDEFKFNPEVERGQKVIISGNVYEDISTNRKFKTYKIELTKIELAE